MKYRTEQIASQYQWKSWFEIFKLIYQKQQEAILCFESAMLSIKQFGRPQALRFQNLCLKFAHLKFHTQLKG